MHGSAIVSAARLTLPARRAGPAPVDPAKPPIEVRRRRATRPTWMLLLVWSSLLAFSYLLPHDFLSTWNPYLCCYLVAFIVRLIQFHAGVGLLLLAASLAWWHQVRLAAAATALGIISAGPVLWDALPIEPEAVALPVFRVMTLNLRAANRNATAVDAEVRAHDPDVVVFQEFASFHGPSFRPTIQARYPYVHVSNINSGVAVYSRLPFEVRGGGQFTGVESQKRTRIELNVAGRGVALYGVQVRRYDGSLQSLVVSRAELATLMAYASSDPLPVIVAGDFNSTDEMPGGAAARSAGFRSAHALAGHGLGLTRYLQLPVARRLVGLRLDHIYLEPPLGAASCRVGGGETGSDHRAVIVDVTLPLPTPLP